MTTTDQPEQREGIAFGTPPPAKQTARYDWAEIAAKVRRRARTHPDEWLLVFEGDKLTIVTALKAGSMAAIPSNGGFEFLTRNNVKDKPRRCDLWMRYVPSKDKTERSK